ncbi:MAG: DNA integrity scanning protein DisA nucleotide-binding domain protein [Clostridiales bacterium]|nr:DNA integrity scanning protein DisA nucleotide-binding domain protein [Clostridiales bacterium]
MLNSELQEKQIQTKRMIDEVCRACSKFSDEKTGALLVFEREVLLGEVIDSGILLEADASAELIGNVFFPKSPLHDGAMVVRDARLHAAGCILPLTKNNAISSALGTRHRAALGMSEVSDAVVIVVSEETGIISLAKGGKLRRNLSDGDIRAVLSESLLKDEDQSGNILERLRRRIKK